MNILSKIILVFSSLAIMSFLIFVTYITNTISSSSEPYYESVQSSKNVIEKIGIYDMVIFSSGSIVANNDIVTIEKPWLYLFDLKEPNKSYLIKWEWFDLTTNWPWSFIINNIDSKKNMIFSLSNLLSIDLKNKKTGDFITNIDLYPHMYFVFNPLKNIFVKNWDLLKISQTFTLKYFYEQITKDWIVSENFLNIASLKNKDSKAQIINTLSIIKEEYIKQNKIIDKFVDSNFSNIPGENLINKYRFIFINPSKQSNYYKNIVLRDIARLLVEKNENINVINSIFTNLAKLEELSKDDAREIKDIINFYYYSVISSNKPIITKNSFSTLLNRINEINLRQTELSINYLEKIFFEYDYLNNEEFYKNISIFKEKYINKKDISEIDNVDYLIFFLENILITSEFSSSNFEDLITIFENYVEISDKFYSFSDDKVKRTWLFTNSKILNKFVDTLEKKYFEEERNSSLLLELQKDTQINKNYILTLEENIINIINIFKNYKEILNPTKDNKDKFIIDLYSSLETKFTEYFSALKNYEEYLVKYDESKRELLETNSINEDSNNLSLSTNNAIKYLENFNWIQIKNVEIDIMDYNYCLDPSIENQNLSVELPYCYKIDNINILNKNISFLLHPSEKNKIDEIYVDSVSQKGSYKLDEIKVYLDNKKLAETKNKEKYDFVNFLVNTFWDKDIEEEVLAWDNNAEWEKEVEEDVVVKLFKRNKLLSDNGDFANLEWFLDIEYNDISVTKKGEEYLTYLDWVTFNINLNNNSYFYGEFSSDYNFSPNHSFINPKFKLINKKTKLDLLFWNHIEISWEYKVNSISEEVKDLFFYYENINFIVNSIKEKFKKTEIKIVYYKDLDKLGFTTDYNWSELSVELYNWYITKVEYKDENRINSKIPYIQINNIFNNF